MKFKFALSPLNRHFLSNFSPIFLNFLLGVRLFINFIIVYIFHVGVSPDFWLNFGIFLANFYLDSRDFSLSLTIAMKFAANISTLCQDIPKLTDRLIHLLKRTDFKFDAIECQNPYGVPISEWQELASQYSFSWVLINTPPMFEVFPNFPASSNSVPKDEYHEKVLKPAIEYARALSIPKVHLVMGDANNSSTK